MLASLNVPLVLLTPPVSRAQSQEVGAIRTRLQPIGNSEAEVRMSGDLPTGEGPADFSRKSIPLMAELIHRIYEVEP